MPLDLLSSIQGARSSEAVNELFKVIKRAVPGKQAETHLDLIAPAVTIDTLRADVVEKCPEIEKELIKRNFPEEKNGYLVVPKVIED